MSFKIYRQDLRVTRAVLVIFHFEAFILKVEEMIVMKACLKNSCKVPCQVYGELFVIIDVNRVLNVKYCQKKPHYKCSKLGTLRRLFCQNIHFALVKSNILLFPR